MNTKLKSLLAAILAIAALHISPGYTENEQASGSPSEQEQTPVEKTTSSSPTLQRALSISDLTIEMAESTWKVRPTLQTLSELANALERYLNENCFGTMLKTLSYQGPPTNPDCLARMERLLDLYPGNPVATCLRDGIESQTCSDAYRGQSMKAFSSSWAPENTPDPALRVGLSAQDREKLRAINDTLKNVNKDYQQSSSNADKQKHTEDAMHLYDQALSIACKIVALQLEDPTASSKKQPVEDASIREVREKLLKLPPALRPDYQNRLLSEAEEQLARTKNSSFERKILLEKIAVINNPEVDTLPKTQGKIRYRVVLPECYDLVGKASVLLPKLPSPTCHRDGWQSPQCLSAIKKWHAYRAELAERKRKTEKQSRPPAGSQISSF